MDLIESTKMTFFRDAHEKILLRRMVERKKDNLQVCMRIMAMWMWLVYQGGFEDLILKIRANCEDEKSLNSILDEAKSFLAILELPNSSTLPTISPDLLPLTLSFCTLSNPTNNVSLGEIFANKEAVLKGIEDLHERIYNTFKDVFEEKGGEGVHNINNNNNNNNLMKGFKLNPYAKEWHPDKDMAPEDDRCLFLTFSNGYPIRENQIFKFFTGRYGPSCVEKVYVHRPKCSKYTGPLFGKVIFTTSFLPALILAGQRQAKFLIGKKPLWCKKYTRKMNEEA